MSYSSCCLQKKCSHKILVAYICMASKLSSMHCALITAEDLIASTRFPFTYQPPSSSFCSLCITYTCYLLFSSRLSLLLARAPPTRQGQGFSMLQPSSYTLTPHFSQTLSDLPACVQPLLGTYIIHWSVCFNHKCSQYLLFQFFHSPRSTYSKESSLL